MKKVWALPYTISTPAGFPAGYYLANDGLYCTIPRSKRVLRRRQWICDPVHVRSITSGGNLTVVNQRNPKHRAIIRRDMGIAEMAAALALIEVQIHQSCLRDVTEFFWLAKPWRSDWKVELAA